MVLKLFKIQVVSVAAGPCQATICQLIPAVLIPPSISGGFFNTVHPKGRSLVQPGHMTAL